MKPIYPSKLTVGAHIRVIAPARSLGIISPQIIRTATEQLQSLGLKVSFGNHVHEKDAMNSSSIESRINDLHDAFSDRSVDGILTVLGGYNSNQLLGEIDYELIRKNPKILCGFSDITVLNNAIFSQTGLVGYSGPHFSSFGMQRGLEYTLEYFKKCLFNESPYSIEPSPNWSEDEWFKDQESRHFKPNSGHYLLKTGSLTSRGHILGGHLGSLCLLQGTKFWPNLTGAVLLVEEVEGTNPQTFDQRLQSILQQPGAGEIKAILIGRTPTRTGITQETLSSIIKTKGLSAKTSVISNVDFGHTTPIATYPIGGECEISIAGDNAQINIMHH